jgi:pyruvate dehydrogenase phosphatase
MEFVDEIRELYENSFRKFAMELVERGDDGMDVNEALENAFLRLDDDMSREAIETSSMQTMSVAMSGNFN